MLFSFRSIGLVFGVVACAAFCGCSDDDSTGKDDDGSAGGGGGAGGMQPMGCTMPVEVPCSDQVIQQMNLKDDVTPGLINNQPDGAGFTSFIDATAGGAFNPDPNSFTYGKFGSGGLVKVEISDEQSLDSMDWDIAFRRYIIRINSGFSGPSCVSGARVPGTAPYDAVTAAPADLALHTDEYFTPEPSCQLIPDGSNLPDSPATALSGFWSYPGCVKMTDAVFVVALADGTRVKLAVVDYYEHSVQEQCDTTDAVADPSTAANYVVRWAFLP